MWPFKCKHPAHMLAVEKAETREPHDQDFEIVTYHLFCQACGEKVKVRHASLIGGVSAFMARGKLVKSAPPNIADNRTASIETTEGE